jgi:hypothetical protein
LGVEQPTLQLPPHERRRRAPVGQVAPIRTARDLIKPTQQRKSRHRIVPDGRNQRMRVIRSRYARHIWIVKGHVHTSPRSTTDHEFF